MKFLFLGKYLNAGLAGFLKNPEDDKRTAISAMVEKSSGNSYGPAIPKRKIRYRGCCRGFELRRCRSRESSRGFIGGFGRTGNARIHRYDRHSWPSEQDNWGRSRTRRLIDKLGLLQQG